MKIKIYFQLRFTPKWIVIQKPRRHNNDLKLFETESMIEEKMTLTPTNSQVAQ